MISPTNGRIVLYTPSTDGHDKRIVQHDKAKPLAAMVVHAFGDRCVNLVVFDSEGNLHPRTSVDLVQDGDPVNELGRYAEWMPYQKGQAAKTEAAEKTALELGAAARQAGQSTY